MLHDRMRSLSQFSIKPVIGSVVEMRTVSYFHQYVKGCIFVCLAVAVEVSLTAVFRVAVAICSPKHDGTVLFLEISIMAALLSSAFVVANLW